MTFTEVIGGVTVSDPFRWLEDDGDAAVAEWQQEADGRAAKELNASPHRSAVEAAVRASFEDMFSYAAPQRFGDNWFRPVLQDDGSTRALEVSSSPTERGRVLVDPRADGEGATIAQWKPSPDGTKVFVATGIAAMHFRILDVATGTVLLDLGQSMISLFEWAADGSGVYHGELALSVSPEGQVVPSPQVWWQPVQGERQQIEVELDHPYSWPIVDPAGKYLAITADQTGPRPRWVSRVGSGKWRRFLADATGMYKGFFVGEEFWAITDDVSGWCRLVAIPIETSEDQSTWRVLVPAVEETKLASITRCGERVALSVIEHGIMRMHTLDLDGHVLGEVALPGQGAYGVTGLGYILSILTDVVAPDGDGCTFIFSNLTTSPGVYRADLRTGEVTLLEAPRCSLPNRVVESFVTNGPHGPVSYRVMRKDATALDGSAPVIATGYGGFNVPWLPSYWSAAAAWTELGGVWVHCHLRGGGERDKEFWHAGRMERKQGTFDDFHAVIADLQERGFATPERTGVWGSSNGGLLVGAALTQIPERLRAVVAQVPILDLMQCRKDPGTIGIAMADYGNPDDPQHAPFMHAHSPYHRVQDGTAYPALLCDAGATDPACPPWHSRKMVAAVQQASTSGHRVLLRVREGSGHNQMTTDRFIQRDVEELTFFCDELM